MTYQPLYRFIEGYVLIYHLGLRSLCILLIVNLITGCASDWLAPISVSTTSCDVNDPWSCPAPLTCIDGLCLRSDQPRCGDGIIQTETGEQCDDANDQDDDRCHACRVTFCGDGVVQRGAGEACDDSNRADTDGCTTACQWARCGDGIQRLDAAAGSETHEECDDGNNDDRDRCSNACEAAKCGDGWVLEGEELCDDGNTIDDDDCSNTCGVGVISVALKKRGGGCLIDEGQKLKCWGTGDTGNYSTWPPSYEHQPASLPNLPTAIQVIAGNQTHSSWQMCVLRADQSVYCWSHFVDATLRRLLTVPEQHRIASSFQSVLVYSRNTTRINQFSARTGDHERRWIIPASERGIAQLAANTEARGFCIRTVAGAGYCMGYQGADTVQRIVDDAIDVATSSDGYCFLRAAHTLECSRSGEWLTQDQLELLPPLQRVWLAKSAPSHNVYAQTLDGSILHITPAPPGASDRRSIHVIGYLDPVIDADLANANDFCAVTDQRRLWCGGVDRHGDNLPSRYPQVVSQPYEVLGLEPANQVAVGEFHSCATLRDQSVSCWGLDQFAQRGSGAKLDFNAPASAVQGFTTDGTIVSSARRSCSMSPDSSLWCWGRLPHPSTDQTYQLVDTATQRVSPHGWQKIVLGSLHSCGIDNEGMTWCWDKALNDGALGQGRTVHEYAQEPVAVEDLERTLDLAAKARSTCAVDESHHVWCWGMNDGLFTGRLNERTAPAVAPEAQRILDLPPAKNIALGSGCACLISTDDQVYCWGVGASCFLQGNPSKSDPVQGLEDTPVSIHVGWGFSCSRQNTGSLYCWGRPLYDVVRSVNAERIELPPVRQFDADYDHVCAVTTDDRVFCWGNNRWNQTGNQQGKPYLELTKIPLY